MTPYARTGSHVLTDARPADPDVRPTRTSISFAKHVPALSHVSSRASQGASWKR